MHSPRLTQEQFTSGLGAENDRLLTSAFDNILLSLSTRYQKEEKDGKLTTWNTLWYQVIFPLVNVVFFQWRSPLVLDAHLCQMVLSWQSRCRCNTPGTPLGITLSAQSPPCSAPEHSRSKWDSQHTALPLFPWGTSACSPFLPQGRASGIYPHLPFPLSQESGFWIAFQMIHITELPFLILTPLYKEILPTTRGAMYLFKRYIFFKEKMLNFEEILPTSRGLCIF